MTLSDSFSFAWLNIRLRKIRTALTVMGVVIGIGAFVFFVGLTEGARQVAYSETFEKFALTAIVVKNKYTDIGIFQVGADKKVQITDEVVEKFTNIPGVLSATPQLTLKFPSSVQVELFGNYFESDAPLFGVDPQLFQDEDELFEEFSSEGEEVPTVLSSILLDIFNTSIAESNNLPRLNESALLGQIFNLKLGHSAILNTNIGEQRNIKGKIVGFSKRVHPMGLTIPLSRARVFAGQYQEQTEDVNRYNTVHVQVSSAELTTSVSSEIEKMGFQAESALQNLKEINSVLQYILWVLGFISFVILFVAALSITNTISISVLSRIKEIGILRACGATRWDINCLFLMESVIIGFFGGILGFIFGFVVIEITDFFLSQKFPDVSFKPESFFYVPLWLFFAALVISVLAAVIAGVLPARKAACLKPIEALMINP